MRGPRPSLSPRTWKENIPTPESRSTPRGYGRGGRWRVGGDKLTVISEGPLERPPLPRGSTLFEQVLREIREEQEECPYSLQDHSEDNVLKPRWRKGATPLQCEKPRALNNPARRHPKSFRQPSHPPRQAWPARSSPSLSPSSSPRQTLSPPPDRRSPGASPSVKVLS